MLFVSGMLSVPTFPPDPTSGVAPLKSRGHRHKRSFAVSGDFDFLRKDPMIKGSNSINNDPPSRIDLNNLPSYSKHMPGNDPITIPVSLSEVGSMHHDELSFNSTANSMLNSQTAADQVFTSPRFFITEEPKFTGGFKDVPDAIINLDDALKTRPRSFKSHRRTESAPADLQLSFNLDRKLRLTEEQVAEEEEENYNTTIIQVEDASNSSSESLSGKNSPKLAPPSHPTLMSPLRARCPSPVTSRDSPSKLSGYNTLKINKQKERYYNYYTKQIPSNGSGSSTVGNQTSSMSISSESSISNRQLSTPNTPVSMNYGNSRKITPRTKPFKYETQVYDIRQDAQNGNMPRRSTVSTIESNDTSSSRHHNSSSLSSSSPFPPLTQDLLLGQPGDSVDLSHVDEINDEHITIIPPNSAERETPKHKSRLRYTKHSSSRSMSDQTRTLQVKSNPSSDLTIKERKHGKFNIISSLFSRPKR